MILVSTSGVKAPELLPPPDRVTIEMSGEEALVLRKVLGAIGGVGTRLRIDFDPYVAQTIGNAREVVLNALFYALDVPGLRYRIGEGDGLAV